MATFIDESGDIGTTPGASKFFRLAAVCFEHGDSVDEYLAGFETLLSAIKAREDFEFHFSEINDRQKHAFFEMIEPIHFQFVVVTLAKSTLRIEQLSKEFIRDTTIQRGLVND